MSHLRRILLALVAVAAFGGMSAQAGEGTDLTISGQLDWASKYVWRGILVNDDAVVQPSVTVGYSLGDAGDLSLNIWGNIDTNNAYNREDNFQEVDYTLAYSKALDECYTLGAGAIVYDFPGQGTPTTTELFVTLAAAVPLSPVLSVYYDIDEVDGWYVNLAGSHEIALADIHENLSLILASSIGWGSEDWIGAYTGVNDAALVAISPSATVTYTASEKLSFSWYAKYDYLLDNDVRNAVAADASNFWFGTNVAVSF
jgi:hypothetical protein